MKTSAVPSAPLLTSHDTPFLSPPTLRFAAEAGGSAVLNRLLMNLSPKQNVESIKWTR